MLVPSLALSALMASGNPAEGQYSAPTTPSDELPARIGTTTKVNRLRITPLAVQEVTRCPERAMCAHPGTFILTVRIGNPASGKIYHLHKHQPLRIHGQYLTLMDVSPGRDPAHVIPPETYRFRFRYSAIKW